MPERQELLRHHTVNVILATGGGPMVRAAHSTGKPAYGVGPGNVPAWVDRSADIGKAARDLVNSKAFDCSLICATEQAVIADEPIAAELRSLMEKQGAYWVPETYHKKLAAVLFHPDGGINQRSVGQTASALAKVVGMDIPADTRVLVVPLEGIGKDYPFSREKLTSVLGFATARDAQAGLELGVKILRFGGDGHSAVIHSRDVSQTEQMAARLPAFRIIVNSMSTLGSIGFSCGFIPSLTLGTGGMGGAIVGDNITVTHLINRKRVAWEIVPPPASVQRAGTDTMKREPSIDEIVAQVLARLKPTPVEA